MHARQVLRLPDEPALRARQDEQDHLVAAGGQHELGAHPLRGRDVGGQGQPAQGRLPLGGPHERGRRGPPAQEVLPLLQPEGLPRALRLRPVRREAQHARQRRVQGLRRQYRQRRPHEPKGNDQVLALHRQVARVTLSTRPAQTNLRRDLGTFEAPWNCPVVGKLVQLFFMLVWKFQFFKLNS